MSKKMKNLIVRTLTGVAFVVILVGGILWNNISYTLLFALITALSVNEFCKLANSRADVSVNSTICTLAGTYLFLAMSGYCSGITPAVVFIPYLLSVVYLLVSELYLRSEHALNNWAFTALSQMYVALPLATLNLLAYNSTAITAYNYMLPLSVFVFLWLNDTGAYCFGSLLGRHKLIERISPNKTWEGSIGGAVTSIAASQLFAALEPSLPWWQWMGLSVVVVLFGTWGDLVESLIKRQLNLKDSGQLLPGHGGMLDRFDSSLMAIPASVIYLYTLTLL